MDDSAFERSFICLILEFEVIVFFCNGRWEVNSCGYHGDDGYLYRGQGKGEPFGPKFTKDDAVGGGINYASQEFFFT